jgi:hypothetical protein
MVGFIIFGIFHGRPTTYKLHVHARERKSTNWVTFFSHDAHLKDDNEKFVESFMAKLLF